MGIIKTLAVVGGGAYALNELSKNNSNKRSANVAVKSTIDPLAVKEAIAKDPNLLSLVRGEVGPQGPQGPQGPNGIGIPVSWIKEANGLKVGDSVAYLGTKISLTNKEYYFQQSLNSWDMYHYAGDGATYNFICKFAADGTISKLGGGSFATLSDERLKQNIEPFLSGLEKIISIEIRKFNYKKVEGTQTEYYPNFLIEKTQYGVIAQELKEVCPEMVTQDEQGFYSVDLSNLPLMLVNAVKELNTKLETVTANYEALLQRIEALETPPATA